MKTETEIKEELEKVNKEIADIRKFLKDKVEFRDDEEMILEDLYFLKEKKILLEWILN